MHIILGTVFHRNKIAINFRRIQQSNFNVLKPEMNCWSNFKSVLKPEMNCWSNFKSFRPKKSQNRTKIGEITKFFIFIKFFHLAKLDIYGASANEVKNISIFLQRHLWFKIL